MLKIKSRDLESILKHSKEDYPREACGIMKGRMSRVEGAGMNEVLQVYQTENIHANPIRGNKIRTEDQYRVYVELDPDLELVGFYHSHPHGPPGPSRIDIEQCNYHGYTFLIVSLTDVAHPDVSAWILYDDRVDAETIRLVE
jgi:proteasome lid subunit RPN8/RPN11